MKKRGFTIVELLVTVAIIAIISVITFGQYRQSLLKANDVRRKTDLNSLYKGLLLVYNDNGVFLTNDEIAWGGELLGPDDALYMKQVPQDPNPNFPYFVQTADNGKKMAIFSNLENKEDLEYNKYCNNGYAVNGKNYHYVVMSSNAAFADFGVGCN